MKTGTDFVDLQPFHFLEKLIKVNSVDCDPLSGFHPCETLEVSSENWRKIKQSHINWM